MQLQVVGQKAAVDVSDAVFNSKFNEGLVHQVVTAYMAGGRQGTKAQKSRSEVRGGGAKPWRQKGTGRARAGTSRSPIWRSGGVTFAAKPRNFKQKINKKMYQRALQSILSELVRQERLMVVNEVTLNEPKTRELVAKLKEWNTEKALIITEQENKNLNLAARNIPNIAVTDVTHVDPVGLVAFDRVIITVNALKKLEERLA